MSTPADRTRRRTDDILATLTAELEALLDTSGPLDPDTTLVALGLDSLAMFDLLHRIETGFGLTLSLREALAGEGTPRSLARAVAAVEERRGTADAPRPEADTPAPDGDRYPLTEGQRQTWFLSQLGDDVSRSFNETVVLDLRGALRVPELADALRSVVDRHESLHSVFAPDGTHQSVRRSRAAILRADFGEEPAEHRAELIEAFVRAGSRHVFDLAQGPLYRIALARVDDDRHLLSLTGHDLVADGGSFQILLDEIAALYNAACSGTDASPLPEPAPYRQFVRTQSAYRAGARRQADEAYWLRRYPAGIPAPELPLDRPVPRGGRRTGAEVVLALEPALADRVAAWGRDRGRTPFTLYFSAYAALLHDITGQEEVTVAVPVRLLSAEDGSRTVGNCVSVVPVTTVLRAGDSFRDLLDTVSRSLLDAYEHARYPLSDLLRALEDSTGKGHGTELPLFNLVPERRAADFAGLDVRGVPAPRTSVYADLDVSLRPDGDALRCTFAYCAETLDEDTVNGLANRFRDLLARLTEAPDRPVRPGRDRLLPESFARHARERPEQTAVICGADRIAYRELDERAERLARGLRAAGVDAESRVAVCLDRSIDLVATVLAVWKANGAYVPLNADDPPTRHRQILDDAAPAVLVTSASLRARFAGTALPVLTPEEAMADAQQAPDTETAPHPTPPHAASLAYVIYTSGSTGRPKGVMGTHGGLASTYRAWQETFGIAPGLAQLQMANFSFDGFLGETIRALGSGGTLVVCPREVMLDPERLLALIEEHRVRIADFVPPVLRRLAAHAREHAETPLRGLDLLIVGSDLVHTEEMRSVRGLLGPHGEAVNCYGVTECTIDATVAVYADGDERHGNALIGRPLPGVEAWVLDEDLRPVPPGETGVLHLGGTALSRGYLGDPAKTAAAFLPHPFAGEPGRRIYRTGDLVRERATPSGPQLEYVGRADDQVKVRGYRIELGEIEAALRSLAGVADAVAVVSGAAGQRKIDAYAVPTGGPDAADTTGWYEGLRSALPHYMLPDHIVVVAQLPTTSNGKVDRAALTPAAGRAVARPVHGAPGPRPEEGRSTDTQRRLRAIWAEALQLDDVGVSADFFDAGGDSLLTMRVIGEIRAIWGAEITVKQFYDNPTVAQLAAEIDTAAAAGTDPAAHRPLPSIQRIERRAVRLPD
ncbi:amino acid adenylation domain-containing protein [Streptomyces sp. NPDC046915]|uniref:non-ribosomal peptide synthetase n=1 Tax=Streptomyces sp. NPDC046915 TaxID=3155257 RepID=UPI0033DEED42